MTLKRLASFILLFIILSLGTAKAEGLLPGLSNYPGLRNSILSQATPFQRCQIQVLEQKLGMQFKSSPPPGEIKKIFQSDACQFDTLSDAQADGSFDYGITTPELFLSQLDALSQSYVPACGFKYRVSSVALKSIAKISSTMGRVERDENGLLSRPGFQSFDPSNPTFCSVTDPSWAPSVIADPQHPFCMTAGVSPSWFVECFRLGKCSAECAVGGQAAEENLMYDVYDEDGSGKLEGKERDTFDEAYNGEMFVGPYGTDEIEGIQGTNSAFDGKQASKKYYTTNALGTMGPQAFTGVKFYLQAKGDYKQKVKTGEITSPGAYVNLGQNGIFVSVSQAAANELAGFEMQNIKRPDAPDVNELVTQFEAEYDTIRKLALQLSYGGKNNLGLAVGPAGAYEKLVNYLNFDTIQSAIDHSQDPFPGVGTAKDRVILKQIMDRLNRPIFNEVQVYVHPYGQIKLAQLLLIMTNHHSDANTSFNIKPTSMNDGQFNKFRDAYVKRCLAESR